MKFWLIFENISMSLSFKCTKEATSSNSHNLYVKKKISIYFEKWNLCLPIIIIIHIIYLWIYAVLYAYNQYIHRTHAYRHMRQSYYFLLYYANRKVIDVSYSSHLFVLCHIWDWGPTECIWINVLGDAILTHVPGRWA